MKKVLSFVLVLSLVLSSFSMAFAGTASDVAGKDCEVAVGALTELGVVSGYTDGTYKPEKAVNRAEAATLVVKALGLGEYAGGNTSSFTDLAGYEWAEGYIGYAEALGILNGDGNGKFRPGDEVTYQEMAKMLVAAVGYTPESLPGTWPSNYVVKAKALGILDGITKVGNMAANRGDVAVMIYNNLDNRIGYVNLENQWVANTPADTMLTRLDRFADYRTEEFVLTNQSVIADGVNLADKYGAYVLAFYDDVDNEIVGIKEVKSTFLTGKYVTDAAVVKFVSTDDVEYSFTSTSNVTVLSNGLYASTKGAITTATAVSGEVTIAAKVSGKTIKDVYSEATWTSVANNVWTKDNAKQLEKNDKILGHSFKMTDDQEIDTTSFVLLGAESLDKIAEDAIVTVYKNGVVTKVEVSTDAVEGKVTKVMVDEDGATYYIINGEEYYVNQATGGDTSDVKLAAEGTFYLDYSGDIAHFEGTAKTKNYAVVTDVLKEFKPVGYSTTSQYAIELFTAEGTQKVFTVDEDTIVTGAAAGLSQGCVTVSAVRASVLADMIVAYTLDKDGNVDSIEVPTQVTSASLQYSSKGYLGNKEVSSNVVVFTGNANTGGSDSTVELAKLADIATNENLPNTVYVLEDDKVVAIITNETTSNTPYGVVVEYGKVENADEEEVYEIKMLVDGKEVTYLSTKDATVSDMTSGTKVTSLYAITLENGVVKTLTATNAAANTTGTMAAIKDGNIALGSASKTFLNVHEDVVVYEVVRKADGSFKVMGLSDLGSISYGDEVFLYDTNTDEGFEGYDVIIFDAH